MPVSNYKGCSQTKPCGNTTHNITSHHPSTCKYCKCSSKHESACAAHLAAPIQHVLLARLQRSLRRLSLHLNHRTALHKLGQTLRVVRKQVLDLWDIRTEMSHDGAHLVAGEHVVRVHFVVQQFETNKIHVPVIFKREGEKD